MSPYSFRKTERQADLPLKELQRQLTLEGLADVDAGRVIDHRIVQAWADSLNNDESSRTKR